MIPAINGLPLPYAWHLAGAAYAQATPPTHNRFSPPQLGIRSIEGARNDAANLNRRSRPCLIARVGGVTLEVSPETFDLIAQSQKAPRKNP